MQVTLGLLQGWLDIGAMVITPLLVFNNQNFFPLILYTNNQHQRFFKTKRQISKMITINDVIIHVNTKKM